MNVSLLRLRTTYRRMGGVRSGPRSIECLLSRALDRLSPLNRGGVTWPKRLCPPRIRTRSPRSNP